MKIKDTAIEVEDFPGDDNDEIKFKTAGNEQMRIMANGDISMNSKLYVNNDVSMNSNYLSMAMFHSTMNSW